MKDGDAITVSVDSRVILDASFFRKMNPKYSRPQPDELVKKTDDDRWAGILGSSSEGRSLNRIKGNGVELTNIKENDLLICYPTVLGFGLRDKLWSIILPLYGMVFVTLIR